MYTGVQQGRVDTSQAARTPVAVQCESHEQYATTRPPAIHVPAMCSRNRLLLLLLCYSMLPIYNPESSVQQCMQQ